MASCWALKPALGNLNQDIITPRKKHRN
jgi:hypothetical protein